MINYEGGFVRRGLMGQLLLFANTIHTFDVRYAILIIELMSYILFFYLLIKEPSINILVIVSFLIYKVNLEYKKRKY